jgi:hypothetical protein
MILLDNTASVLELIWDIAVFLIVMRLAFLYFVLTFFTGCILGYIRLYKVIPIYHLSPPVAELLEMPIMLLAVFIWARLIMVRFSVPNVAGMRLAIGFLALGFLLLAELGGEFVKYENGLEARIFDTDKISSGAFAASLVLFGLMPWLLMALGEQENVVAEEPLPQKKEQLTP